MNKTMKKAVKTAIRKEMLAKRRSLDKENVKTDGAKIVSLITDMKEYEEADTVLLYSPVRNEADITKLFETGLSDGKNIAMPKVINDTQMEFYKLYSYEDMTEGYMGIPEPKDGLGIYIPKESERVLMIVPGVAFDKKGGRIGMGKGYYDRYLGRYPMIKTVGVCGEYQLIDNIPMEENDIFMEYVVTEKKIYSKEN